MDHEELVELEELADECVCDAPDPDHGDEPWVPVRCGNCGRLV